MSDSENKIEKTTAEWRELLGSEQFRVCRERGTERAFTGKYLDMKEAGSYTCACCEKVLFDSRTKYDSGSGWPSFYEPANSNCVQEYVDNSLGMERTEVVCSQCDSHLGHVFPDGPAETSLRYCINSASLGFAKKTE